MNKNKPSHQLSAPNTGKGGVDEKVLADIIFNIISGDYINTLTNSHDLYAYIRKVLPEEIKRFGQKSPPISVGDGWIKVEDGLPESVKDVLLWREHFTDVPISGYYFAAHKTWHGGRETRDCMKDGYVQNSELDFIPTHWKPLPSAPLEQNPVVILGTCQECKKETATKDYNGHKYYVCDKCYDKLNDAFDEEYR